MHCLEVKRMSWGNRDQYRFTDTNASTHWKIPFSGAKATLTYRMLVSFEALKEYTHVAFDVVAILKISCH